MAESTREADLVSVIIPAFNAERWIDETLRSVRSQSYRRLEIIVVDDGSEDRTVEVAQRHATLDRRVRVVSQENGGVASARNRGIAETHGAFLAPVDADDLWSPAKIARQMELMRGRSDIGLVYTPFALIDAHSRVTYVDRRPGVNGPALEAMCLSNVVGNGSAALMRRSAVIEAGCYDTSLHAAHAQGCEDYKLYFQIAERYQFGCVNAPMTGYREASQNMSSDFKRMLRSRDLVVEDFRARYPQHRELFDRGRARLLRFMLARSLRTGRVVQATAALGKMVHHDPMMAANNAAELVLNAARSKWRRFAGKAPPSTVGTLFEIGDPGVAAWTFDLASLPVGGSEDAALI